MADTALTPYLRPHNGDLAGCLTAAEVDATMAFAEAEKAASTRRGLRQRLRRLRRMVPRSRCQPAAGSRRDRRRVSRPLRPDGLKASTIGRRVAAIADWHKAAGCDPVPTSSEAVRAVMRGIRRTIGTAPDRKSPVTAEALGDLLKHVRPGLIGIRDRALLTLGFVSAMRRSELVALQVADLVEVPDGYRVLIRRSKTDPTGEGQEVAVPRGFKLRPVEAVQAWLAAAEINSGPVFRAVRRGGRVVDTPMLDDDVARVVKWHAKRAGLDPKGFAGHSLRSGFVTSCVEANAPLLKIAEQTRHRSLDMLRVYSRRADLFRVHAAASFV